MEAICAIARKHGLIVIEDAAQAHGAERGGTRAGAFGAIGCFSFYPGKNLGACGEGGAISTNDPALAQKVKMLRDWGQEGKYNHVLQGYNFRLDALQAAALDVKLRHLESWTEGRRRVANAYHRGLAPSIARAAGPFGADHVGHVYAILVDDRAALQERLKAEGVSTGIHYPRPVHQQPAYAGVGRVSGDLAVTEAMARRTLSLPIYPELSTAQIDQVIAAVNRHAALPAQAVA